MSAIHRSSEKEAVPLPAKETVDIATEESSSWTDDKTQRKLKPRHIQLVGIAGRFVDDAFGVAAGYNFFFQASLVPYEITVCNLVIRYWTDAVPVWAVCLIFLALYGLLNYFSVSFYGEAEFWLSIGSVILIVGLILYTFIVMVGGNPHHDAFGFRYWKNPGSFATLDGTGDKGRFLGFLYCLVQAAFAVAGPEYVSMCAGEAVNPRKVLPQAYRSIFWRLTSFFMLGSLAVGILVTASQLLNFCVITFTYTRFRQASAAQGLYAAGANVLPYGAPLQPYASWFAFCACLLLAIVGGWSIFLDGNFNVPDFLFQYMMLFLFPVIFVGWKLFKKTKWLAPHEVNLTTGVRAIEEYTAAYTSKEPGTRMERLLDKAFLT